MPKATPISPCSHLEKCALWATFKTNGKLFWIKQYCEGYKQDKCARAKLSARKKEVPDNLLPNGEYLD